MIHYDILDGRKVRIERFNSSLAVVNYDKTIKRGIIDSRCDVYSNKITAPHFPRKKWEIGSKKTKFFLYSFSLDTETNWIIDQMKKQRDRPATLRELLAFGSVGLLRDRMRVIALGSSWNLEVPYLGHCLSGRHIGLHPNDEGWLNSYYWQFLAAAT